MTITTIKVADEVWLATALLHRENPEAHDFSVAQIVQRAVQEGVSAEYRQGVQIHASHHCVAQKRPNPPSTRHRMLTETARGRRRLFREGDDFHPERRTGKVAPDRQDLADRYHHVVDWYWREYSRRRQRSSVPHSLQGRPAAQLLALAGSIPPEELHSMEEAIHDCERVDWNEW
jgi:hypothetical protein